MSQFPSSLEDTSPDNVRDKHLSRHEVTQIAEEAAERAVTKVLFKMGLDLNDPDDLENFRENNRHTTKQRKGIAFITENVIRAGVTVLVGAIGIALYEGIRFFLSIKGGH